MLRQHSKLIPLVLITGFLGAGKTTLLRKLVESTCSILRKKPYVIINDYQNAKVDSSSFQALTQDITPIDGSCVCCDSRVALLETLERIAAQSSRPDIVYIEVNGTSDAVELIEILALADAAQPYELPIHINVIDLYRWQRRVFHNDLERWQTAPAHYVHFSRFDRTEAERIHKVRQEVQNINPHAQEITNLDDSSISQLIESWIQDSPHSSSFHRESKTLHPDEDVSHSHVHPHSHTDHHSHSSHHHLSHAFNALEIALPNPLSEQQLQDWIIRLPENILRVKGLFVEPTRPGGYTIFQLVQGYDKVEFMDYKGNPPITPTAVVIGQNLNPADLQFTA
ncbi:MAG: GTP-binding protein [Methylacidiphilales bacterium]|nr:GTP-binding protein [Candidatus Methylacidiphilales bacterium]MDW8349840.1 GTP-binding protein [Verrucomicrobiae bacterium]